MHRTYFWSVTFACLLWQQHHMVHKFSWWYTYTDLSVIYSPNSRQDQCFSLLWPRMADRAKFFGAVLGLGDICVGFLPLTMLTVTVTLQPCLSLSSPYYSIALNFRGSLISRISRIFNCLRKYFNESTQRAVCACSEFAKLSHEIFAIRENLDPQKFSDIRYIYHPV